MQAWEPSLYRQFTLCANAHRQGQLYPITAQTNQRRRACTHPFGVEAGVKQPPFPYPAVPLPYGYDIDKLGERTLRTPSLSRCAGRNQTTAVPLSCRSPRQARRTKTPHTELVEVCRPKPNNRCSPILPFPTTSSENKNPAHRACRGVQAETKQPPFPYPVVPLPFGYDIDKLGERTLRRPSPVEVCRPKPNSIRSPILPFPYPTGMISTSSGNERSAGRALSRPKRQFCDPVIHYF